MKNLALTVLKSVSFVLVFTFLFTACSTDKSLTQTDFYKSRVVNKRDNRGFELSLLQRHYVKDGLKRNDNSKVKETVLSKKPASLVESLAEFKEPTPAPVVSIASIDNNLFVDPVKIKLTTKISTLYQKNTDVRSFHKGYSEIKKEQVNKFKKNISNEKPNDKKAAGADRPGMSIASFVLGIVGLIVAGLICGSLAIVFGVIGMKRGLKGLAIAGLILGIIDVVAALIIIASM
jgi:hypothetical protein